jgi:hypothetical protein
VGIVVSEDAAAQNSLSCIKNQLSIAIEFADFEVLPEISLILFCGFTAK